MTDLTDETGFDPFISELFVRAIGLYEAMQAASPAAQVAMIDNPLVSGAEVIVAFTWKPEGMKLMFVRGSSKMATIREIPLKRIAAFMAPDIWTYAAYRIVLGDLDDDAIFRDWLANHDPEALKRLPHWLTPAGETDRHRLKGNHQAHAELIVVDRFAKGLGA